VVVAAHSLSTQLYRIWNQDNVTCLTMDCWLMMVMSSLYYTNMLNWIFIVLTHWNNNQWEDMSLHSDTLSWFRANQSSQLLRNQPTLRRMKIYYYWTNIRKWNYFNTSFIGIEGEKRTHPRFADCSGFLVGSVLFIFLVVYVVLLCVFTFLVPCCDVRYDFHKKRCSVRLCLQL
jgi:hypothetical protein